MNRKIIKFIVIFAAVSAVLAIFWRGPANAGFNGAPLEVNLKTSEINYTLGEPIELQFEVSNRSAETVSVVEPSVGTGSLRLFVSTDGVNYAEYVGPGWGTRDGRARPVKLPSGEKRKIVSSLLFNQPIQTSHLTELYADMMRKNRITTTFAIAESGQYWLKAAFRSGRDVFESQPIMIGVTDPVGQDAAIWAQIKDEAAFAYLLHTGDVPYPPDSPELVEFRRKSESLTTEFRASRFTDRISASLARYDAVIESLASRRAQR